MTWVCGMRDGILYTITKRAIDPRWSNRDLQDALGWCATGQHLGWSEQRAFQAAEAIIMKRHLSGITWPESQLTRDIDTLIGSPKCHEGTTLVQEEL